MIYFKVEQHEPLTLHKWAALNEESRLDLSPEYQRRGNLWNEWKKAHLIDTVLNNFDVPKLYVADFTRANSADLNKSRKPYSIVDGKQRFGAFFGFLKDEFPLNKSFTWNEDPKIPAAGLYFSELRERYPSLASKLEDYIPIVMSIITNDELKITEMFTRLNSGVSANSAERRNAMPGPASDLIRQITVNRFFMNKIRFNTARMQEHNLAAKLALIEFKGGFTDTKAKNLDLFVEQSAMYFVKGFTKKVKELPDNEINQLKHRYNATEEKIMNVLDLMTLEFKDQDPLLASQGHIPVYYWIFRNHYEKCQGIFHEFLDDFTARVKSALHTSKVAPEDADPELMNYYTMGRTTNDQQSLKGRYEILLKHLLQYEPKPKLF